MCWYCWDLTEEQIHKNGLGEDKKEPGWGYTGLTGDVWVNSQYIKYAYFCVNACICITEFVWVHSYVYVYSCIYFWALCAERVKKKTYSNSRDLPSPIPLCLIPFPTKRNQRSMNGRLQDRGRTGKRTWVLFAPQGKEALKKMMLLRTLQEHRDQREGASAGQILDSLSTKITKCSNEL